MEVKKRGRLFMVWRALWPLILYSVLTMAVTALVCVPLGFTMLESTLLTEVVCIPVFLWIYRGDRRRRETAEGFLPMEVYLLIWAVTGTAALAYVSSQLVYMTPLVEWSVQFQAINDALVEESLLLQVLTSIVAAPVVEELMMRGVLYGRLRDLMPVKGAMVCSALLFGIFHGNLVQGVHAFLVGLMLAWLMERFQNILVPILGHMAANLASLVVIPADTRINFWLEILVCIACVIRTIQVLKIQEN